MVHGRGSNPHRSLWRHWWRHKSETIRDLQKRRPRHRMKSSELNRAIQWWKPQLRQLLQNRKLRHWWRHNLGSTWKLQKMARENFSIRALYNITKNQHSPYILGDTTRPGHVTCVLVWSKSDQRRLRKTLHKQTNRHYENNGHLAVNQLWSTEIRISPFHFQSRCRKRRLLIGECNLFCDEWNIKPYSTITLTPPMSTTDV